MPDGDRRSSAIGFAEGFGVGAVAWIVVLTLRARSRTRVWTLAGGAIPPLSLVVGFWYWLLSEGGFPIHGSVLGFTLDSSTQGAAAVICGTLLAVAAAPYVRRSGG